MAVRPAWLLPLLLAGCYATHAPWDRAAPDGSAIGMRVQLGEGPVDGFLDVRFDGTYAASPVNELRVCTGALEPEQLAAWTTLIRSTDAFARDGLQGGSVADGGRALVELRSEDGLVTGFALEGGPSLAGYDPALFAFWQWTQDFLDALDLDACAPIALDHESTSLRAWFNDDSGAEPFEAVLEIRNDGSVAASFDERGSPSSALEPCPSVRDRTGLWASVLASAPFDPRRTDFALRDVVVSVETTVTVDDGSAHERGVWFHVQRDRVEQAVLDDTLAGVLGGCGG